MNKKMALNYTENTALKYDEICGMFENERLRVLVADDDHATVLFVSRMLEMQGVQVDAVNNGVPAINCLSRHRYDVVITGLEIPNLSGYALACWLKEKSPDTRVIIMSGRSRAEAAPNMKKGIVDCWLFKPFSTGDLKAAMEQIVEPDLNVSLN